MFPAINMAGNIARKRAVFWPMVRLCKFLFVGVLALLVIQVAVPQLFVRPWQKSVDDNITRRIGQARQPGFSYKNSVYLTSCYGRVEHHEYQLTFGFYHASFRESKRVACPCCPKPVAESG